MKILALLPQVAYLSEVLSIVFFLCFLKRNKGEGLWIIFLYCVFSVLAEIIGLLLVPEKNKFYFWAFYTITEYSIFAYFFYTAFKGKKIRYIPLIGSFLFCVVVGITFYNRNTKAFDSLSASMEALLMIIYSIVFLYDQMTNPEIMYVYNSKKFWMVIAFFLYFSSTLFLFLFASSIITPQHSSYWTINNSFEILKNVLLCVSFAMKKSDTNQNSIKAFDPDLL